MYFFLSQSLENRVEVKAKIGVEKMMIAKVDTLPQAVIGGLTRTIYPVGVSLLGNLDGGVLTSSGIVVPALVPTKLPNPIAHSGYVPFVFPKDETVVPSTGRACSPKDETRSSVEEKFATNPIPNFLFNQSASPLFHKQGN